MIFPWFYRKLPGGRLAKLLQLGLFVAVIIALLFMWIFPAIDSFVTDQPILG